MLSIEVIPNGPLVTDSAQPIIDQALNDMVQTLMEKGEERLGQLLQVGGVYQGSLQADGSRIQTSTGYYRANVAGQLQGDSALITDGGVVYGPWLENGASGTRFAGYHVWRQVADWLEDEAQDVGERILGHIEGNL